MRMTRRKFLGELVAVSVYSQMGKLWARAWNDTTSWDPFVEEIADTATYLRRKFRQDVTDRTTGLGIAELDEAMKGIVAAGKATSESWRITKAKCFAELVMRQSIDVSGFDWFPAIACWNRLDRPIEGGEGLALTVQLNDTVAAAW